jgi:tetratricopeptide (TPR) repeat protein|tara:strand:+ start:151 stop:588 length:438 start_codon:yes stop_codon:yes gene_type:complete
MKKSIFCILLFYLFFNIEGETKENFFEKAKSKYDEKEMEDSKFLFQRNIVFNPKDAKSYLYLAKIYNFEKNEREELKNLKTTLLLDPDNEEAMYMLISIELEKSNFFEVKNLTKKFNVICLTLCEKVKSINERLENIEVKNESKQ